MPDLALDANVRALAEAIGVDISTLVGGINGALAVARAAGAYPDKASVISAGTNIPAGASISINGVHYLKMPAGHVQFGSDPIADLPGYITATEVSNEAIRARWAISNYFGGAFRALHTIETTDATTYTGSRSSLVISRLVTGSGSNGPGTADSALHLLVGKADPLGEVMGEIDALRVNAFQDGLGDSAGILVGAFKKVGTGAISEGGSIAVEAAQRRFSLTTSNMVHFHKGLTGFSPNPMGAWDGRNIIGFFSSNKVGPGFSHFHGVDDGEDNNGSTMRYLIAGYRQNNQETRYFSITPSAEMDIISRDNGSGPGPIIRYVRASASPAANDVLGDQQWIGKNSAGADITYARTYSALHSPTAGSETGSWVLFTPASGVQRRQFLARDGISIGEGIEPQGTGTINTTGAMFVNSVSVVDASRGIRHRGYTTAALAAATNAVNTTDKVEAKAVWDMTNKRVLYAHGSDPTSPWGLSTGTVAINPV